MPFYFTVELHFFFQRTTPADPAERFSHHTKIADMQTALEGKGEGPDRSSPATPGGGAVQELSSTMCCRCVGDLARCGGEQERTIDFDTWKAIGFKNCGYADRTRGKGRGIGRARWVDAVKQSVGKKERTIDKLWLTATKCIHIYLWVCKLVSACRYVAAAAIMAAFHNLFWVKRERERRDNHEIIYY